MFKTLPIFLLLISRLLGLLGALPKIMPNKLNVGERV